MTRLFERTVVLTNNGVKEAKQLTTNDKIWNGKKYVDIVSVNQSVTEEPCHIINFGKGNLVRCFPENKLFSNGKEVLVKDFSNIKGTIYIDNIERYFDEKYQPIEDKRINNNHFAFVYGVYVCSCKNSKNDSSKNTLSVLTKTSLDYLVECFKKLDIKYSIVTNNDNKTFDVDVDKSDLLKIIGGYKLWYMQYTNNESYKNFLYGVLASRGMINVTKQKDGKLYFDIKFSTNNEKVAYGIQFDMYRRFGIRVGVRLSRTSNGKKTFRCTLVGSTQLIKELGEKFVQNMLSNLYINKTVNNVNNNNILSNVELKNEYDKSHVVFNMLNTAKASTPQKTRITILKLKETTVIPIYGYIKIEI